MQERVFEVQNTNIEKTLTCGQTFSWHRMDGKLFEEGDSKFYTFKRGKPLIVEQSGDEIITKSELSEKVVKKTIGLHRDYEQNIKYLRDNHEKDLVTEKHQDLNLVKDEPFPCLISYICSSQMRIPRIKRMFDDIATTFGESQVVEGNRLIRFPTPEQLAEASEQDLRDLGLGYRAEYVVQTVQKINEEGISLRDLESLEYEEAKRELKEFHGVGDKVADCVLLFSLDFTEAVPLDTWAKKVVAKHFPELEAGTYQKTAQNLRENLAPDPGIAQEYLFHAARNGDLET